MNDTTASLLATIKPNTCLSFDAEFARGVEMLELSAINLRDELIYTQRFKPKRFRTWDTGIHHISPAMVANSPRFSACLPRIQRMIDNCTYIVGFAVRENDLAKMRRQHVQALDSKIIIELRDWFWICYGRERGMDLTQGISLKFVCDQLGVEQDETKAHTSAYDAFITLRCFKILFERFVERYDSERHYTSFHDVLAHFDSVFKKRKYEFDREKAAGYCTILRCGDDYLVKSTKEMPDPNDEIVECIAVDDRKKTLNHLAQKFIGEARARNFYVHRLTPDLIKYFRRMSRHDQKS